MPYLDKDTLTRYVIKKYHDKKKHEISPVKLQKSMYLLYAMWAGNSKNINSENSENREGVSEFQRTLQVDLFEPNFEAWQYGPVDREIYRKFKFDNFQKCYDDSILLDFISGKEHESTISSFINSILDQVFEISDFSLVDLTHKDVSWDKVYKLDPTGHSLMNREEIINEYAERLRQKQN